MGHALSNRRVGYQNQNPVRSKVHPWQSCSRLICFISTLRMENICTTKHGHLSTFLAESSRSHTCRRKAPRQTHVEGRLRNIFSSSSNTLLSSDHIPHLKPGSGHPSPSPLRADPRLPPHLRADPRPSLSASPPHHHPFFSQSIPQLPQDHLLPFSLRSPCSASVSPHARRG